MKKSAFLIIRPPNDRRRLEPLRHAIDELRADGHRIVPRLTFEPGDARRWARRAALRGADVVIAAGGDGTINQVVNGLAAADSDTPLAVVPLGTANDFARGLGLPLEPQEALRAALEGIRIPLDIARVNRRCFVNVSTGGFAAEATRRAMPRFKRMAGSMAYVARGAQLFWGDATSEARFIADGDMLHAGTFAFFAVGNARMTGGGTPVAPDATPQDGLLDVTIVTDMSRPAFLRLLPRIRAGTHLGMEGVISARVHELDVVTQDEIAVNADGEIVAGSSFHYDVLPRAMSLIVPMPRAGEAAPARVE